MDRLHAVKTAASLLLSMLALSLLAGCDDGKPSAEAPRPSSRVNAVAAAPEAEAEAPQDFCDVWRPADAAEEASAFAYPPLDAEPPAAADGWRWINVWATWCKPCVEELPRLAAWESRLADDGLADVVFVSVDETAEIVESFRADHQEAPATLRVSDPTAITPWITGLGLDAGAPLPVHIFVDPAGKARCMRVAGIAEEDYEAVRRLLGS